MSITNNQRTREALFRRLSRLARRSLFGTLSETYRTCGRPGCRCHQGHKHGPHLYVSFRGADGTTTGFDLELIRAVRAAVTVPVIASGGAGTLAHFAPAVDAGADAVLAASVFHFGALRIGQVKNALRGAGYPVR